MATVHERWLIPENFAKGLAISSTMRRRLFAVSRAPMFVELVRHARFISDVGRHSDHEIEELAVRSLGAFLSAGRQTLPVRLSTVGVDATAFAILAGPFRPFESSLRQRAEQFGNLVAYADRMMARYYPEFGW